MTDAPHAASRAIFPGSFDPLTMGHVDMIERAGALFDRLIVGVLVNAGKTPLFGLDERVALVRECFAANPRIEVETFDGLLVEFARRKQATLIVRGLRGTSDFDYERQMAIMNRHLHPAIETLFLMPSPRYLHISSTLVRDIAARGGPLNGLVPPAVIDRLTRRREAAVSHRV
jgi:pantetheine-phosphate adenylyltransferase